MLKKLKELSRLANKVSLYTNINDTSHFLYGIILAGGDNNRMRELSNKRAIE